MSAEIKSGKFSKKFETKVSTATGKKFKAKLKKDNTSAAQWIRDQIQKSVR